MAASEFKIRLILASFGVLLAALLSTLGWLLYTRFVLDNRSLAERGAEFNNIADLRAALASADTRNAGRVTLGSIVQPHSSDQIIYDLRPNLDVRFQNAPVSTNRCGMRDRELPLEKPADVFRIALIGDSFTFGWGVEVADAFPHQLERILNQIIERATQESERNALRYKRVEVLNFGVPGYSPFQEVATFEEKALSFQPDAVVLFFIENDFGMPFFIRDISNAGKLSASTSGNAEQRKHAARSLPKEFDPNHALIRLGKITRELGIPAFISINPKNNWRELYDKLWALRQAQHGRRTIRFMNTFSDFDRLITERAIDKADLTLVGDQHPTPLKHQMIAEVMAPYFLEFLFKSDAEVP